MTLVMYNTHTLPTRTVGDTGRNAVELEIFFGLVAAWFAVVVRDVVDVVIETVIVRFEVAPEPLPIEINRVAHSTRMFRNTFDRDTIFSLLPFDPRVCAELW